MSIARFGALSGLRARLAWSLSSGPNGWTAAFADDSVTRETVPSGLVAAAVPSIAAMTITAATFTFRHMGIVKTASPLPPAWGTTGFAGSADVLTCHLAGAVAIAYGRALADREVLAVMRWLARRYGIAPPTA